VHSLDNKSKHRNQGGETDTKVSADTIVQWIGARMRIRVNASDVETTQVIQAIDASLSIRESVAPQNWLSHLKGINTMQGHPPFTRAPDISTPDEITLIVRVKAGDQDACRRLVELYRPRMMTVARRYMRCEDDCNDAIQNAFISAFKALDRFEGQSRLSTWLQRITVNACLMKLRQCSYQREMSIEEFTPSVRHKEKPAYKTHGIDNPSTGIESDETRSIVRKAIDQLPDAYRSVLLLRDIEEMDSVAIAGMLATTENNVKMRLHRGRRALRALLAPMMAGAISLFAS
jgi:RNA polymerase sigma-70 factor (ECF subfamily)